MIAMRWRSRARITCFCASGTFTPWPPSAWSQIPASTSERGANRSGAAMARLPNPPQPVAGIDEIGVCSAARHRVERTVAARIRPEVPNVGADPLQGGQCLPDPLLRDVPLTVDREAVLPDAFLGRAGFDASQVHAAGGELGEDLQQRAGVIRS